MLKLEKWEHPGVAHVVGYTRLSESEDNSPICGLGRGGSQIGFTGPKSDAGKVAVPIPLVPSTALPAIPRSNMVTNVFRGRTHLWKSGLYTLCKLWKCGSSSNPVQFAVFDQESDDKCRRCFQSDMLDRFMASALGGEVLGEGVAREGDPVMRSASVASSSSSSATSTKG